MRLRRHVQRLLHWIWSLCCLGIGTVRNIRPGYTGWWLPWVRHLSLRRLKTPSKWLEDQSMDQESEWGLDWKLRQLEPGGSLRDKTCNGVPKTDPLWRTKPPCVRKNTDKHLSPGKRTFTKDSNDAVKQIPKISLRGSTRFFVKLDQMGSVVSSKLFSIY